MAASTIKVGHFIIFILLVVLTHPPTATAIPEISAATAIIEDISDAQFLADSVEALLASCPQLHGYAMGGTSFGDYADVLVDYPDGPEGVKDDLTACGLVDNRADWTNFYLPLHTWKSKLTSTGVVVDPSWNVQHIVLCQRVVATDPTPAGGGEASRGCSLRFPASWKYLDEILALKIFNVPLDADAASWKGLPPTYTVEINMEQYRVVHPATAEEARRDAAVLQGMAGLTGMTDFGFTGLAISYENDLVLPSEWTRLKDLYTLSLDLHLAHDEQSKHATSSPLSLTPSPRVTIPSSWSKLTRLVDLNMGVLDVAFDNVLDQGVDLFSYDRAVYLSGLSALTSLTSVRLSQHFKGFPDEWSSLQNLVYLDRRILLPELKPSSISSQWAQAMPHLEEVNIAFIMSPTDMAVLGAGTASGDAQGTLQRGTTRQGSPTRTPGGADDLSLAVMNQEMALLASMSNLKSLKQLSVTGWHGSLPGQWSVLRRLARLDLSASMMVVSDGVGLIPRSLLFALNPFPEEWKVMKHLNTMYLDLSGYRPTGAEGEAQVGMFLDSFTRLTNLNTLSIMDYPHMLPPREWSSLIHLHHLWLTDVPQVMMTLPPSWPDLQWQVTLNDATHITYGMDTIVSYNIPTTLFPVPKKLQYQFASLRGTLPASLMASIPSNLTYLDLRGNRLTGRIPFINSSSLEVLLLDDNQFTGLPDAMHLPNLKWLSMSNNKIEGTIPASWWVGPGLSSLQGLDLSNNSLSGTIPFDLLNQTWRFLSLHHNLLRGTVPRVWPASVGILLLQNNQLTGYLPSSWPHSKATTAISFANNQFSLEAGLPAAWAAPGTFPNLTLLDLEGSFSPAHQSHSPFPLAWLRQTAQASADHKPFPKLQYLLGLADLWDRAVRTNAQSKTYICSSGVLRGWARGVPATGRNIGDVARQLMLTYPHLNPGTWEIRFDERWKVGQYSPVRPENDLQLLTWRLLLSDGTNFTNSVLNLPGAKDEVLDIYNKDRFMDKDLYPLAALFYTLHGPNATAASPDSRVDAACTNPKALLIVIIQWTVFIVALTGAAAAFMVHTVWTGTTNNGWSHIPGAPAAVPAVTSWAAIASKLSQQGEQLLVVFPLEQAVQVGLYWLDVTMDLVVLIQLWPSAPAYTLLALILAHMCTSLVLLLVYESSSYKMLYLLIPSPLSPLADMFMLIQPSFAKWTSRSYSNCDPALLPEHEVKEPQPQPVWHKGYWERMLRVRQTVQVALQAVPSAVLTSVAFVLSSGSTPHGWYLGQQLYLVSSTVSLLQVLFFVGRLLWVAAKERINPMHVLESWLLCSRERVDWSEISNSAAVASDADTQPGSFTLLEIPDGNNSVAVLRDAAVELFPQ